jgi:hypothetical protein
MPGGPFARHSTSTTPATRGAKLFRFALVALAIAGLADAAWMILTIGLEVGRQFGSGVGYDYAIYVERTQSWLGGDGFYLARQLAGPYSIEVGDALYPPPTILLFLPWALGAPAILWWLIPLAVAGVSLRRLRPPLWAWVVLVVTIVFVPRLWVAVVLGNPSMWVFAAILAGWAFEWPAVLVLIKPALAVFSVAGARWASWWRALGVVALASLAFAPMWLDYARVLLDAQNRIGLDYLLGEIPIAVVLSIVGYAGFRRNLAGRGSPAAEGAPIPAHGAAHAPSRAIAWK